MTEFGWGACLKVGLREPLAEAELGDLTLLLGGLAAFGGGVVG